LNFHLNQTNKNIFFNYKIYPLFKGFFYRFIFVYFNIQFKIPFHLYHYYQILQLKPTATLVEIKKAYRKLAHEYHPDVSTLPDAREKFIELNEAYEYLLNKIKLQEDLLQSKEAFTDETAQSVIDAWLIAERERMQARARKHASMRYGNFKDSDIYRSSDAYSRTFSIIAFSFGLIIIAGATYGTWSQCNDNPRLINANYIGSAIIVVSFGLIMTGFAFKQMRREFRMRKKFAND